MRGTRAQLYKPTTNHKTAVKSHTNVLIKVPAGSIKINLAKTRSRLSTTWGGSSRNDHQAVRKDGVMLLRSDGETLNYQPNGAAVSIALQHINVDSIVEIFKYSQYLLVF